MATSATVLEGMKSACCRRLSRLAWAPALAVLAATDAAGQISVTPSCKLESGPLRSVAQVLDGETIRLDDTSEVRLIGALAPRASDVGAASSDWPLAHAARQALAGLVQGRSVSLAFAGRRTDRYGRWLAHLLVERAGTEQWVQGDLLEQGMARAYTLPGNTACIDDLIARERIAREAGRGLWLNAAYQIRSADQPQELLAYAHSFQLVSGRITSVSARRGLLYINFGDRGRTGFAVIMHRAQDAAMPLDTRQLEGRMALTRGWPERRSSGPLIEIHASGELELLDKPGETGARSSGRASPQ